jgi:hypothetical protein
MLGMHFPQYF